MVELASHCVTGRHGKLSKLEVESDVDITSILDSGAVESRIQGEHCG